VRGHIQCDGGLQQSGIEDTNNCTIRAFAIAFGVSYKDAHNIGSLAGRPKGQGYWMYRIMDMARQHGYNSIEKNGHGTLGAFLKKNNKGRFICVRRGHAFAVVDGKIYDNVPNPHNCKLIRVFKVDSNRIQYLKGFCM
jgi:hypothetical protein